MEMSINKVLNDYFGLKCLKYEICVIYYGI